jgi:magnesium chelatase family protein
VEVPPVTAADLALPAPAEGTAEAAARVAAARQRQAERALAAGDGVSPPNAPTLNAQTLNALADGRWLETIADPDEPARALLAKAAEGAALTARGWTRTLRLARTIADLDGSQRVRRVHIAEALIYRRVGPAAEGASLAEPSRAWSA